MTMEGTFPRKLLVLSCCFNVLLYLLITYKCDVLPSGVSHTPRITSRSFVSKNSWKPNETPGSDVSSTKELFETNDNDDLTAKIDSSIRRTQRKKLTSSNIRININKTSKSEWGEAVGLSYDPSFGTQHQAKDLPPRDINELFARKVPNMVYYVWCGQGHTFLYKHFVSVYSIWYQLEPDVIEIHYEFPPLEDKYNTWLSWLRSNIPSFSLQPLPSHVTGSKCGTRFGLGILSDRGGFFLDNGVALYDDLGNGNRLSDILTSTRSFAFFQDGELAWAAAVAGDTAIKRYLSRSDAQLKSLNISSYFQPQTPGYNNSDGLYNCSEKDVLSKLKQDIEHTVYKPQLSNFSAIIVCYKLPDKMHPVDIIQSQRNSTGKSMFYDMLYGVDAINRTQMESSSNKVKGRPRRGIPHTVHYIWFGPKNMSFSMYLSFLSTVFIVQPDVILIHSDLKLYGHYWDLVVKHQNVHLVYREAPRYVYNHRILYTQHRSDIVRADVLDKYGGIYLDWDALWLKSPKDLLVHTTSHDIILSRDHIPRPPFPETINMGVVLAKPRSKFIRAWRAAWLHYRSNDFLYNAVELPYKIYELFPQSSLLHDWLQVMCYYLKCHPLFHPDHKHWGRSQPFDWTQDVHSIHFTHPDPPVFQNETALMSGQGTFADIGRFIWDKQGNID